MPRMKGLNRHQERFFSKLRRHPDGLPPEQWPRTDALQRWLRQPAFLDRLAEHREVADFLRRYQMVNAARLAAQRLASALDRPGEVRSLLAVIGKASQTDPLESWRRILASQARPHSEGDRS
jgi:hypothetical protein